jgi:AcrR family transcriptional regulator
VRMEQQTEAARRPGLSRDRVLRVAVALADESGLDTVSMRNIAQTLGVVPMALYKHVANKEELLAGMVDIVVGEIDPPADAADWRASVRGRILSARRALLRHPWASQLLESAGSPAMAVLDYMDSLIGVFRTGGLSADLTHHAMHALGSRIWGFTQLLFPDPPAGAPSPEIALAALGARFPNIAEIAMTAAHDDASMVGRGCDDQFEFEFALDLMLEGFERLHRAGWSSAKAAAAGSPLG